MRRHPLSFFLLAVFAMFFSNLCNVSVAISPTWLVRTATSTLENTCQCDCCYPVGIRGRTECIPPIDTSFDVSLCSKCDVDACAARFPVACAQPSSVVLSDCITRKGWMLRIVPIFFIAISAYLLCYGFFFKKFDGYHDDNVQPTAPVLRNVMPQPYNTFTHIYSQPGRVSMATSMDKPTSRTSSTLPPILETEEMSASPYNRVSATMPSSIHPPQLSLGEQHPNALRHTASNPE